MMIVYLLVFGAMLIFSASVLYAFYWSAKTGQFSNLQKAAESIFDHEEPIGQLTDSFPGEARAKSRSSSAKSV